VPLRARGWIGDGIRGALISADGTIDWYGPSGVSGPPACWSLLDPSGGAVRVGPVRTGTGASRRLPAFQQAYRRGSNVLETVLDDGAGGRVSILDLLPWAGPGLSVPGQVIRVVTALAGPVEVEVEVLPAGAWRPTREVAGFDGGLVIDDLVVRTGFPLHFEPLGRDAPRWRGTRRLEPGAAFVVTLERLGDERPQSMESARRSAMETEVAWRSWLAPITYDGPYRAAVERSLLAVRSLTGPGGAPSGAGTTSLPRRTGSERGADDRWVQFRDVAAAVSTWAAAGFPEDAEAAENWLREAAAGTPLPWPGALDPDGQPVPELEILGLAGWRRSQPVVVGRLADLIDLDLYGDVIGAYNASTAGPANAGEWSTGAPGPLSAAWPALAEAADWVADHWWEPDGGVWASIGPPARLVASRVQAWFALDRMARMGRDANPLDLQAAAWHQEARRILAWLEADALTPGDRRGPGGLRRDGAPGAGDDPDAALVRIAWRGPWPRQHPFVAATVDRVLEQLGSGDLVYRYSPQVDDGKAGPDNPDLLASLWAVRALAELGRWEEAHSRLEAVVTAGGDLGLLSETVDAVSGELLGNLPCTAVHLALVDAAVALTAGPR
jgi:GH15 family glucan-1,4-alpha-glucosidase